MATRPPRLKRPHTYFHIATRGTNRWNIFLDDDDRKRFMALLKVVCKRYEIEVTAYCLMGNHVHLVLYCPEPVLSSAMRDLKSRYATYFHRRHPSSGPLFEGPFVEVPILDDEHLMIEVRYTHRNPLDLDPNVCLASYEWSSHGIYLGLRPEAEFMNTRVVRRLFGPDYQLEVERPRPNDKVRNRVGPSVHTPGVCTLEVGEELTLAGIMRLVATAARCELVDVTPQRRNGLIGVAVVVAFDIGGFSASEIAEPFGYKSPSAVHMAGRRARVRLETDATLHAIYSHVSAQLEAAA